MNEENRVQNIDFSNLSEAYQRVLDCIIQFFSCNDYESQKIKFYFEIERERIPFSILNLSVSEFLRGCKCKEWIAQKGKKD